MDKQISGTMIYNYFVCKRKLWYFYNNLTMEHTNENVAIGKLIDENTFKRKDKHITIDDAISIDFVNGEVHEVKKSKKIEEAGIWQTKYYLYYLKQRGVEKTRGTIHYPSIKEKMEIELNESDEQFLEKTIREIEDIIYGPIPQLPVKKGICRNCAYLDLCWI